MYVVQGKAFQNVGKKIEELEPCRTNFVYGHIEGRTKF